MIQHLRDIDIASRKQVFQGAPLRRGVRMKGKSDPSNSDLELAFQSLNTPGDEIAPGSDVI
jgi:hypothetical protein